MEAVYTISLIVMLSLIEMDGFLRNGTHFLGKIPTRVVSGLCKTWTSFVREMSRCMYLSAGKESVELEEE